MDPTLCFEQVFIQVKSGKDIYTLQNAFCPHIKEVDLHFTGTDELCVALWLCHDTKTGVRFTSVLSETVNAQIFLNRSEDVLLERYQEKKADFTPFLHDLML